MKFSIFCASFLSVACMSSGVTATEIQRPGIDSYALGESWEWKETLVADSAPDKLLMESFDKREVVLDAGEKKFLKTFSGGAKTVAINDLDASVDETPFRKWPLKVGVKWVHEEDWTSGDGTKGYTKQDVEVTAVEKISVPSGTYSAYKIVHRGIFKNARGTGPMNDTYWYVPEMKADVKHINESGGQTYTSVLIKYTHGTH